ncbi:ATP-binding protein [Stigmatella erecta]|nr:ATP-binding protein [Stigmatella erecta]
MRTSTTPYDAATSSSSAPQLPGEPQSEAAAMPADGGEMGALMRSIDWAQTPVGPQETWPQSLRTALSILLESRVPMYIAWGPQFVQFYNDGYRPILGSTKHPGAMGRSASSSFEESWHILGPMFEGVRQGQAVGSEDRMLPLDRNGHLEECYFTFAYSPIRDESGGVGGVHATVTETTGRVLGERRLRTLKDLAARAGPVRREHDAWREAARVLEGNALDVPFALLYRLHDADQRPELVAAAGWGTDPAAAVSLLGAPQANPPWPFADAALTPQFVPDARARFAEPPKGTWPEAPRSAWVLPIPRLGSARLHGFLVAGLSARRAPDGDYREFLELVAERIATAISHACANEEGDRRVLPRLGAEESFIQGGGEMGALMRSFDWSKNSLGPIEAWPQSLRTSVSTMLRSPYPIILFWGPELRMLYNDPFRPILGAKHPQTLGARGHEALAEEWALLGPLMKRVHETGEPLFIENGNVNFARRPGGLREEAYFTWSYNPTIGERGEIAGLFAIASETTRQVVGDRRLGVLRELSIRAALDKKVEGVFRSLEEVLAQAGNDLPFALLYAVEAGKARLVSCAGLARGAPAAPLGLSPGDTHPWPLAAVASLKQEVLVEDLHLKWGHLPGGPWPEPATRALVLPVPMGADTAATGVLVAGLSPLVALDGEYRSFLQLLARQLAASISSARAYEQEKQRAEELALLDQAKTAFFSNVSHEFRTPLTLILGPIEDALSRPEKSLEGEKLGLVRRSALRLYKMVNTLLDFSRMEAGRAQAHYVPVDLSAVTRNLASAFQSAVESAGLRLVVECPPLPEPLYVDPEMWEKVVLNLLSNAVKYTYEGEIRLGLSWQERHAVLTVRDTGVGIPEEELPRVFERFYRVRVTQGRSHEGTGIGLALVQELVKLHGGSISVESKLGEGTVFTLRLPRGSDHLPPERIERTPRPDSFAAGIAPFVEEAQRWSVDATGAGMLSGGAFEEPVQDVPEALARSRILLVDDNADLRTYVAGLLGRVFRHVETATNGNDALERVRAQPPDLILSDVMMPGLDGFGLVRALRAGEDTRAIPIILLSARAGDESTVEGLQSGADDYLVKPFSARELMVRVRTQLDMARVRREVARGELEKKILRESVRMRDEFLSLVSHELRTPVAALSLNFQSMVRSLGSEDRAEASPEAIGGKAQTTQKQLHRLERLVERLLDVSEAFTGRLKLTRQEVDLSAVASAVVEQARTKAAHAGCVLTVNAPSPIIGHGDRVRLHQILQGLLDNALKFGAGNPVEVAVRRDSDHAFLTVVDHGEGIRPEDQERIFGRFERAVSEKHYGGFGLGLWLARYIAEAHAGNIRFMPTEGGGATFTVALPLNGTLG